MSLHLSGVQVILMKVIDLKHNHLSPLMLTDLPDVTNFFQFVFTSSTYCKLADLSFNECTTSFALSPKNHRHLLNSALHPITVDVNTNGNRNFREKKKTWLRDTRDFPMSGIGGDPGWFCFSHSNGTVVSGNTLQH